MNYKIYNMLIARNVIDESSAQLQNEENGAKQSNTEKNPTTKKSYVKPILYVGSGVLVTTTVGIIISKESKDTHSLGSVPTTQPRLQSGTQTPQLNVNEHEIKNITKDELSEDNIFDHLCALDDASINHIMRGITLKHLRGEIHGLKLFECNNVFCIVDNTRYIVSHNSPTYRLSIDVSEENELKKILFEALLKKINNNDDTSMHHNFQFHASPLDSKSYIGIKISTLIEKQRPLITQYQTLQDEINQHQQECKKCTQELEEINKEHNNSLDELGQQKEEYQKSDKKLQRIRHYGYDTNILTDIENSMLEISKARGEIDKLTDDTYLLTWMRKYFRTFIKQEIIQQLKKVTYSDYNIKWRISSMLFKLNDKYVEKLENAQEKYNNELKADPNNSTIKKILSLLDNISYQITSIQNTLNSIQNDFEKRHYIEQEVVIAVSIYELEIKTLEEKIAQQKLKIAELEEQKNTIDNENTPLIPELQQKQKQLHLN